MRRRRAYYVYMLLCSDGSYYTGYTGDVTSRFTKHRKGTGARYTKMRRPEKLVYAEKLKTRGAAMRRENQIKSLTHNEKRDLARKWRYVKAKSHDC